VETSASKELDGQVAIVTGAARGIGRAIALRLARLGADVVIADRNLAGAAEFGETLGASSVCAEIEGLGRRSLGVEGDLRHREAADALVQQTLDTFGRVDILVNNAGGSTVDYSKSMPSIMSTEDMDVIFDMNMRSTVYCAQAAAGPMRKRRQGAIVNISSIIALNPSLRDGLNAHYGMAKAAVTQFTRFLAAELGPEGVRVNAIAPGITATARIMKLTSDRGIGSESDLSDIPLRRFGKAEDIAGAVQFLVTDLSSYVTGVCIPVCGGRILTPS
jgi:NAD(P)-dependent dehydrogenase (short-subunit alcohol dehydrogenase family)